MNKYKAFFKSYRQAVAQAIQLLLILFALSIGRIIFEQGIEPVNDGHLLAAAYP